MKTAKILKANLILQWQKNYHLKKTKNHLLLKKTILSPFTKENKESNELKTKIRAKVEVAQPEDRT